LSIQAVATKPRALLGNAAQKLISPRPWLPQRVEDIDLMVKARIVAKRVKHWW